MLQYYNKKELEELGKLYGVKGAYKLNKGELIQALTEAIPANMARVLASLTMQELDLFEKLIIKDKTVHHEEDLLPYYNMINLGLVDIVPMKSSEKVKIQDAVKKGYQNIDHAAIRKEAKRNQNIRNHIMGLLNLYGAAEISWVCELYNRYHTHLVTPDEIIQFVKKDRLISSRSKVAEDYIVEETIYSIDEKNIYEFVELTRNKPYYAPSKEYIERLSDELYYDNTLQVQKLKNYFKKHFTKDETLIEEAVLSIVMIGRVDCDRTGNTINLVMEELGSLGIQMKDFAKANEVIKRIMAVMDNTRKWINKGYTSVELSPSIGAGNKGLKVRKLDLERNALCSCGSGKKYKKCCGKPKD